MRVSKIVVVALAMTAAISFSLVARAGTGDKVTGGGQTDVGTQGAGDTIAFTAQTTNGVTAGQIQYIDRTGGTGQGQVVYHGTINCLTVSGSTADFSGVWDNDAGSFEVVVQDNGNGNGQDMIAIDPAASNPSCSDSTKPSNNGALARGNAQVTPGS